MRMSNHYKQLLIGVRELVSGRYRNDYRIFWRLRIIEKVLKINSERGLTMLYSLTTAMLEHEEKLLAEEIGNSPIKESDERKHVVKNE